MLLLWIICVISVLFLLCFRARLFINALWSPAGRGLASWLSFVMSNYEVVTFPLVSWVRCGAWLYRFLISALFLTINMNEKPNPIPADKCWRALQYHITERCATTHRQTTDRKSTRRQNWQTKNIHRHDNWMTKTSRRHDNSQTKAYYISLQNV